MLRFVTITRTAPGICYTESVGEFRLLFIALFVMQSIADLFAARLQELRRIDEESNRRTQELLNRTRSLIQELEAIDLETEY